MNRTALAALVSCLATAAAFAGPPWSRMTPEPSIREIVDGGSDGWFYAGALGYSLSDRVDLMTEVSGVAETDFDEDLLDVRVGFDAVLTESLHLLFSIAAGLREPVGEDELDYDIYLGLQLFL